MGCRNKMKSDKLKLTSKPYATFNIMGVCVKVRIVKDGVGKGQDHFCAYAELKNSNVLSERFLGNPTYRKNDWVGVDTAHAFNMNHTLDEKLCSAIHQIETIIQVWKESVGDE